MKYKILPIILLASLIYANAFAQSCIDLRHPVYDLSQIDSIGNLSYAGNNLVTDFYHTDDSLDARCTDGMGCDSSNAALIYDVYYPGTAAYTQYDVAPLPAVIMFHSGSFSDCSSKTRDSTKDYCKSFAQRGFVVFNVEYRRGRLVDARKFSPEQVLAAYRSVQDANGAIRSIIQRQINNETIFKFDTSKLFLAGSSSGAIIALNIAFCNQSDLDSAYPGVSDPGILGPVLKDDYYGALNIPFSIKGVLSNWGGLIGNGSTSPDFPDCIASTDRIPVIAFHGRQNRVIPDTVIKVAFSSGARAIASQCDFTYNLTSTTGFAYQYGSTPIYKRLQSLNIPGELYLDTDGGQGLDSTTDFGLPTSNTDSVEDYIVSRAAIFFTSIIDNTTGNIKQTMFVDTEDTTSNCDNLPPSGITDSLALVDLYNSTNGPRWINRKNWLNGPVKSWYGITVTGTRVTGIALAGNRLRGSIPASIGDLTELTKLNLRYNRLSGPIPSSVGNLTNLEFLYLQHNRLEGDIPATFMHLAPHVMNLSFNRLTLTENAPFSFENPDMLLNISHNNFTFNIEHIVTSYPDAIYYPQSPIAISQNGNMLSVSAGGTLSNNTYKWFLAGSTDSTVITGDSSFLPKQSGRYYAHITNSIATKLTLRTNTVNYTIPLSQSEKIVANNAGVKSLNRLSVYPNPASGIIHIILNGTADVTITNAAGNTILTKSINNNGYIDVSKLAAGIYYIQNKTTGEVRKVKVIHD